MQLRPVLAADEYTTTTLAKMLMGGLVPPCLLASTLSRLVQVL
jgi:hypothetical protein